MVNSDQKCSTKIASIFPASRLICLKLNEMNILTMFQVDGRRGGPVPNRAVVLSDGNADGLPQAQRCLLAGDVSHVSVDVARSCSSSLGHQAWRSVKVALI